jgi:hypothetical protein
MNPPPGDDSRRNRITSERQSLHYVRAAQLRNRALRWAIGKSALGTIFLIGALAYALSPDHQSGQSRGWTALLLILSTLNIGLGLRTFARVRRGMMRHWLLVTIAWGVSATILVRILMRR